MKPSAYHIIRVGIGITFAWIGILIFQNPEAWASFLQPWAQGLLPVPIREAMIGTAILDVAIGALLLTDTIAWIAATVGAIHLMIVLTVSGIDAITVRDIGLLAGCIAVAWTAWPAKIRFWKQV